MKKVAILLIMSIFSMSTFANTTMLADPGLTNTIKVEINQLDRPPLTLALSFNTSEELYAFDIAGKIQSMVDVPSNADFCTTSISLTVSVGAGRTYVSATVTAKDVPCEQVGAIIELLRAQLKAALK